MSLVALGLLLAPGGAAGAQEVVPVPIGYLELEDDSRYAGGAKHAGIEFRSLGRPLPGARLGVEDAGAVGPVIGADFTLLAERAASVGALAATVRGWAEEGARFVLADLPAEALLDLADAVADAPVLLLNVSARPLGWLAQHRCAEHEPRRVSHRHRNRAGRLFWRCRALRRAS